MRTRHFSPQVKIFKALAQETRLFLIDELSRGERCVCELAEMAGADVSTISTHLSILRDAGMIASDKRGLQVFYHLLTPCVLQLFSCVKHVYSPSPCESSESNPG